VQERTQDDRVGKGMYCIIATRHVYIQGRTKEHWGVETCDKKRGVKQRGEKGQGQRRGWAKWLRSVRWRSRGTRTSFQHCLGVSEQSVCHVIRSALLFFPYFSVVPVPSYILKVVKNEVYGEFLFKQKIHIIATPMLGYVLVVPVLETSYSNSPINLVFVLSTYHHIHLTSTLLRKPSARSSTSCIVLLHQRWRPWAQLAL
jgi:hypothetical protein